MKNSKQTAPAETKRQTRNILVVDDHPLVRKGVRALLASEADLTVTAEASNRGETLDVLRRQKIDLVILDISLEGSDGIEISKAIRAEFGPLPILIVSMHDETLYAERALRAGANGYVMKDELADSIVKALRAVLEGKIYVSDNVRQKVLRDLTDHRTPVQSSPIERLSDRELEVFRRIGEGLGTREIAQQLHLSIKTIETYRAHIKEKLSLATASELTRSAVSWVENELRGEAAPQPVVTPPAAVRAAPAAKSAAAAKKR
jgi:DNA-binding NarL/FixJ family response regulator